MRNFYGYHYINGYRVDVFGYDPETERIDYEINGKCRKALKHYVAKWGGNPYPGTLIEYYNLILPNGKRARLSVYA